jgi:hypothetical protein
VNVAPAVLLGLCWGAFSSALQAQLLPADRATLWSPGIPGGIPHRTTTCTTLSSDRFGDGRLDASVALQAALDGCAAGQVVMLSAGRFTINHHVILRTGVTLRGAGPGVTTLQKTNGAISGAYRVPDAQPIVIVGPSRWPSVDESTTQHLVADGEKGAFVVAVADARGFAPGQFVVLDEDNYTTGFWQSLPNRNGIPTLTRIWATDRVTWQRHSPPGRQDDPFPEALKWFSRSGRPVNEIKEIAEVRHNLITFTTPLHIGYRTSHGAQLTRYTGGSVHVKNAGLEDLTVTGGSDGAIRFESAAYCWLRNVEDTVWLGEGVAINHSFRVEVRDSYLHDGAWSAPGGGGYALSLAAGSAEILVENNIAVRANKLIVARSAGAGSVVGYNYMDDGFINYDPAWQEVGINGSHMVGPHHMLFEGNQSFNYDSDNTHGSAIFHTVFRNHLTGLRRDFRGLANGRAAGLGYGSWWHTFIGNVLGVADQMSGWRYEDPGDRRVGHAWGNGPSIWKLGYDPIHWEQAVDPKVASTVIREGNFDYVTGRTHWDGTPHPLPDSLYLKNKPAFFGSRAWPWVDPIGATKLHQLPARERYESLIAADRQPQTRRSSVRLLHRVPAPERMTRRISQMLGDVVRWFMSGVRGVCLQHVVSGCNLDSRLRAAGFTEFLPPATVLTV